MSGIINKEFLDNKEDGFALILTLWVLMILSVLILTFTMSVNSNIDNASYIKDKIQASVYAEGAINLIAVELIPPEDDKDGSGSTGSGSDNKNNNNSNSDSSNSDKGNTSSTGTTEKVDEKKVEWFFEKLGKWYVNSDDWTVSRVNPGTQFYADGGRKPVEITCVVTAEDGNFPLNSITKLKELPSGSDMSPIVFKSIKEYLKNKAPDSKTADKNSSEKSPQSSSNENNSSSGSTTSKTGDSKNDDSKESVSGGSFSCLAELLEVNDVDSDVYDGTVGTPGLKDYMTVFSDGKIYINRSTKEALALIPGISSGAASQIASQAQTGNYLKNYDDLNSMIGANSADTSKAKQWLSLIPKYLRIKAKANVHGISATVECVVKIEKNNLKFVLMNRG